MKVLELIVDLMRYSAGLEGETDSWIRIVPRPEETD